MNYFYLLIYKKKVVTFQLEVFCSFIVEMKLLSECARKHRIAQHMLIVRTSR